MKFAPELFPKGTFNRQESDGAYINENLSNNLDIYAEKIVKDMHFCLIISGNDAVGNGKSTLATHVGSYLTWKINKQHKIDNNFTHKNMVFKAKDLIDRSFGLPKHSVIVLDEGDDLTEHGMKEIAREIKKYFRKCRQLNQILILILPSFFELPKFYSLSRSQCLMNVKFKGRFDRGFFDFYGPSQKKELYLKGKREWNYNVAPEDFAGRFFGSYVFFPNCNEEAEAYRQAKYNDMLDDEEKELTPTNIQKEAKVRLMLKLKQVFPKIKVKELAEALEVDPRTIYNWVKWNEPKPEPVFLQKTENRNESNIITTKERQKSNNYKEATINESNS